METKSTLHIIFVVAFLLCEAVAAFFPPAPIEPYRLRIAAFGWFFFGLSLLW
jgi:hypothetical protein